MYTFNYIFLKIQWSGLFALSFHKHIYLLLMGIGHEQHLRCRQQEPSESSALLAALFTVLAHCQQNLRGYFLFTLHLCFRDVMNLLSIKASILLWMQIFANEWIADIHFSFDKDMHLMLSFKKCIFIQPFKNNWHHCHNYLFTCSVAPGINYECKCNQECYHTFNK